MLVQSLSSLSLTHSPSFHPGPSAAIVMPQCDRVNVVLRQMARTRVSAFIENAYETLYNAIVDPLNEYGETAKIIRHTPEQISIMLS